MGGSDWETDSNSWFKNFDKNPAFLDSELILIPVHIIERKHWVAAAISIKDRYFKFFDSLQTNNDNKKAKKQLIKRYAKKIHAFLYKYGQHRQIDLGEYRAWAISNEQNIPQQDNGNDCGIYALLFIEYLSRGTTKFDFQQSDVSKMRKIMIYELAIGRLLPRPFTGEQKNNQKVTESEYNF